jgi:hypothetical protein
VVIEAMVIPALDPQLLPEILDHGLPQKVSRRNFTGFRCLVCDIIIMSQNSLQ